MSRRIILALLVGIITLVLSSGLWAESNKKAASPPQVPDGWIVIPEALWLQFDYEPDTSFLSAREAFFLGDYEESADAIRNGITFMRVEVARTTAKGDERLLKAIRRLDKLADAVEAGKVKSVRKLDRAFAHADMVLAKHYHAISKALWSRKESKATAQALGVSTRRAKRAIHWAGADADKGTMDQLQDVESIAETADVSKLPEDDSMNKSIEDYGTTLDKFLDDDAYSASDQAD